MAVSDANLWFLFIDVGRTAMLYFETLLSNQSRVQILEQIPQPKFVPSIRRKDRVNYYD